MNEYVITELTYPTHPKTSRLRRRLGGPGVAHLLLLWANAGLQYPNGIVPLEDIETLAEWEGDAGAFLQAVRLEYYNAETGELAGWMKPGRSGEVLAKIARKADEKRERDKLAAKSRRDESRGVAPRRSESSDVAHTETETYTDPDPPDFGSLPEGQRVGAGARVTRETPELTPLVDRLAGGVRKHMARAGGVPLEPDPAERELLAEMLIEFRPGDASPEAFCGTLLELLPKIAASGEFGRGPLPESRKKKFIVKSSADLAIVLGDALVLWPPVARPTVSRKAWTDQRIVALEQLRRQPGQRLTPAECAEIAAQVQREADERFGPGPAPPAAAAPAPERVNP